MSNPPCTAQILCQLGILPHHISYRYVHCAVDMCGERPECLQLVTKWLYPDVGRRTGKSWQAVETGIRRAATLAWTHNRPLLEHMVHHPLPKPPTATELIAAIYYETLAETTHRESL